MATTEPPVVGVLVVRAWIEDHPTAPLRAVVTTVTDVTDEDVAQQVVLATVEEVCQVVRRWLESLGHSPGSGARDPAVTPG